MCGIAGWFDPASQPDDRQQRLARMCDVIRHRGPDDHGYSFDGPAALGSRRLSIVDLSGGHQPMTSSDGRVTVVFNGEIYNHRALRRDLEAKGHVFRTSSDTEVIIALYQREGLDAVHRFNGMFAIAIYDRSSRELHLIRDRLGVKPLYYHFAAGRLTFGSEIKAVLAGLDTPPAIDPRAIWDYLTLRFVPAPGTIWQGIKKLPPAHRLTIAQDRLAPMVERYWDIPVAASRWRGRDEDIIGQFEDLLRDAVGLRMLADVPVGILLSGGLDSSVVAAMAMRASGRLTTFSVGFRDCPDFDETPFARAVSRHLGTKHAEVLIGVDEFCDFLPEFVYMTDEPLADLASVPLFYVCRLARNDVKVVLSGEGSDEILGGYTFDVWAKRWDAARPRPDTWRDRLSALFFRSAPPVVPETSGVALDLRKALFPLTMTNYLTSDGKRELLQNYDDWPDSLNRARADLERAGDAPPLDQALYSYCQDWLVEDLLMKADKMSMANSIELRTPFLDYRVVEYAARMPDRLKVAPDATGAYRTKVALRQIAKGLLPDAVISRPKQGFPVPAYDWLSGDLHGWARDVLLEPSARLRDWCQSAPLASAVECGTSPEAHMHDRHRLWNLIILELWLRRWSKTSAFSPSHG